MLIKSTDIPVESWSGRLPSSRQLERTAPINHAQTNIITPSPHFHVGKAGQFATEEFSAALARLLQRVIGELVNWFLAPGEVSDEINDISALADW